MMPLATPEAVIEAARANGLALVRDSERLRMRAPKPPPQEIIEAVRQFKSELLRLLSVPTGDAADFLEDVPPIPAENGSAPCRVAADPPAGALRAEFWAAGVRKLTPSVVPADFTEANWQATVESARVLSAEWGHQLAALGWDTARVFGCHHLAPWARIDCAGLALMLRGRTVKAAKAEFVALETTGGTRQTFRVLPPSSPGETVPLWQLQAVAR